MLLGYKGPSEGEKRIKSEMCPVSHIAVVATSLIPGPELLDTMKILTIPVMGMPVVAIWGY